MKTKILGIVTMVTVLLMMLVSSVNAAEFTADKTEMKKGDEVTLTVTLEEPAQSVQFDVEFDASKYEYVTDSVKSDLVYTGSNLIGDNDNVVRVSAFANGNETTTTITLTFKALENGEELPFTISGTEFVGVDGVEMEGNLDNTSITTTIADPVDEPTEPEEPGDVDEPTNPEKPGNVDEPTNPEKPSDDNNDSDYVDEDGNPITKLPQTGSVVPAIIAGVAILVVASLVVFKATRK